MSEISYRPERPEDAPQIEALIDRTFGPGRHAKAADRLRDVKALTPDYASSE